MDAMDTTGLDLKVRRIRLDIKANRLAAAAGKHPAWVSRIESRRIVPSHIAREYLDALATLATIAASQSDGEAA